MSVRRIIALSVVAVSVAACKDTALRNDLARWVRDGNPTADPPETPLYQWQQRVANAICILEKYSTVPAAEPRMCPGGPGDPGSTPPPPPPFR